MRCKLKRLSPAEMIGSLVAVPLPAAPSQPTDELDPLQVSLYDQHRFEVPVFAGLESKTRLLRVSLQAYNQIGQIERLADVLRRELNVVAETYSSHHGGA